MKFLDANVFLFARLDEGSRGSAARKIMDAVSPANPAATTPVVLNEVFWNLRKPLGRAEALSRTVGLANLPGLKVLPVGDAEWSRALALMATHSDLKPNDAIHAAATLQAGIRTIVSSDPDFDGIAGLTREAYG